MNTKIELDGINAAIALVLNGHGDFDIDYTIAALSALFARRASLIALIEYDAKQGNDIAEVTEF